MSVVARFFEGSPQERDEFVRDCPGATFFHEYDWLQLVAEVYWGQPFYVAAYEETDLVGVLPLMLRRVIGDGKILVSVPYADEVRNMCPKR